MSEFSELRRGEDISGIPIPPDLIASSELAAAKDYLEAARAQPEIYKIEMARNREGVVSTIKILRGDELIYFLNVEKIKKLRQGN